jgi:hypothetical protein
MSSLFNLATATAAGGHRNRSGYQISRSVRFRGSASATFTRTPTVDGNRKVWTWSGWVKRGSLAHGYLMSCRENSGNDGIAALYFQSDQLYTYYDTTSTNPAGAVGPAYYRDPSAWYHIVWAVDAANTIHYVYVNNVLVSTDTSKYPPNYDYAMNRNGYVQNMGSQAWGPTNYFDGYMTEVNFVDGQVLTPSSFGVTDTITGVWRPKKYTGTYGTNGFYLNFSDNSAATAAAIGKDYSGNGNNWTPNNISVTAGVTYDSMLDVPTLWGDGGNGRGNYAALNPLAQAYSQTRTSISGGNLNFSDATSTNTSAVSGFLPSSGKWYFEMTATASGVFSIGLYDPISATGSFYRNNGAYSSSFGGAGTSGYSSWTTNDVIGVAWDADSGNIWYAKNNTWQSGSPSSGTSPTNTFTAGLALAGVVSTDNTAGTKSGSFNFGQQPFTYTPPTGFKALNTLNLPTPTILKGNKYFDTILWSGDGVNGRTITANVGTVDFAWVKKRNGIDDHRLANSVTGGNKHLKSNATDAEATGTTVIQAFSGSTFTVGSDNSVNASGGTYVGWTWQKGATQGFDIVTYTGTGANTTISHSLGVAPRMIIVKGRSLVSNWNVFHKSLFDINAAYTLQLNSTTYPSGGGSPTIFNSTAPDGSVFSLGSSSDVNGNGSTYVAYLFSEVAGFSKFGIVQGNANADGVFGYCGFRPRWILFKEIANANNWYIYDTVRDTYNVDINPLWSNLSAAESTSSNYAIDILSNGFKFRTSVAGNNTGGTIFAAFAETPFKYALAR